MSAISLGELIAASEKMCQNVPSNTHNNIQEEITKKIKEMVAAHQHYLARDCEGWEDMCFCLSKISPFFPSWFILSFIDCNLNDADFSHVTIKNLYISHCQLKNADFSDSFIRYARVLDCDLTYANFLGTTITNSIFSNGTKLTDIEWADTTHFIEATFCDAINPPDLPMICPEEGEFVAWKKAYWYNENHETAYDIYEEVIVKLRIPADADRLSGTSRKCRASYAEVLQIYDMNMNPLPDDTVVQSIQTATFTYQKGKTVYPDSYDTDRWHECSHGIHFFLTKQEARNY